LPISHKLNCSGTNLFNCSDGAYCISSQWKCDGDYDCYDRSDEANCSINTQQNSDAELENVSVFLIAVMERLIAKTLQMKLIVQQTVHEDRAKTRSSTVQPRGVALLYITAATVKTTAVTGPMRRLATTPVAHLTILAFLTFFIKSNIQEATMRFI
ncbi:hypothetical protein Anas_05692, partial [Armadillidium nasatum]